MFWLSFLIKVFCQCLQRDYSSGTIYKIRSAAETSSIIGMVCLIMQFARERRVKLGVRIKKELCLSILTFRSVLEENLEK